MGEERQNTSRAAGSPDGRVVRTAELLRGANEVMLEHNGQIYRLRATSNGKLILTK